MSLWRRDSDIAIVHEFHKPPYGGGNQFLLALRGEFQRRGLRVATNTTSSSTLACLFNSFNFDFDRLRRMKRPGCRMVHRVDGPISVYRGVDDGTDSRIAAINAELADATVFQSRYSLERHADLGIELKNPMVIMNASDPAIFFPGQPSPPRGRKVKLITSSWSDNPNKGAAVYKWLDNHLDWSRFEYTFVGRVAAEFKNIRLVPPVASRELSMLLRGHDIFITASLNDPCSNSLLEALACGLPAVYVKSGGHPEIVGQAGLGFTSAEEIPAVLDQLVMELDERRARISVPTLSEAAARYLDVMGIQPERQRD